jgi:hypothetical protein
MGRRAATLLIASMVGFAAPISLYAAGSHYLDQPTSADAMPSYEILTRVRSLALDPIGQPLRRGPYYILHAYDRRGAEMRVVADAHFGDVISVTPATLVGLPGPGTVGGARIIHVPAPGEEEASTAPDAEPEMEQTVPDEPVLPRRPQAKPHPKRAVKHVSKRTPEPRRRPFSNEPPPPAPLTAAERRAILMAPPPPSALDDGPTPIRPTPRFDAPGQAATIIPPPPPPSPAPPSPPATATAEPPAAAPADAAPAQD